ncbi:MAG: bifunctional diaminohydroxyphosphoribosylaminopyrimidine deaminase/5-amino-6-(5-phosphoribosylamino)uracil reductase RibD [Gorillibacterium sp.]|nr:bifunctional diaminohydroxyphosphoribosylaminopyrimidine deaminase/5-amino-6-(5-phosphoribosylamino)uracil reductase RibD [Gorillibacterium sp.]
MDTLSHEYYMDLALNLARATSGQTDSNPAVGCVIVKAGRIIGMGAHLKRGTAHAEVHALNMAGNEAEGATAYVTLEPCSHHGRTPPCADRLVAEKVARVVVAALDPNPLVAGQGIARLTAEGIDVIVGVRTQEALALNEMFNRYIVTKRPYVTLKTASTLDGRIATSSGDSKWITNALSRDYVHQLRHNHQAIMVGIGTILADDPMLTTRLEVPGLDPIRVVVDSTLRLPLHARLFHTKSKQAQVIIFTTAKADPVKRKQLEALGAEVLLTGNGPQVDLSRAMELLGEREIGSVLLEGGGRLNGAMLESRLIDKMVLFYAPKIVGGRNAPANFDFDGFNQMSHALKLTRTHVQMFGDDICLTGYPDYAASVDMEVEI